MIISNDEVDLETRVWGIINSPFGGSLFSWLFSTQFPLQEPVWHISGRWDKPFFVVN